MDGGFCFVIALCKMQCFLRNIVISVGVCFNYLCSLENIARICMCVWGGGVHACVHVCACNFAVSSKEYCPGC